jgi:hypothetical protein
MKIHYYPKNFSLAAPAGSKIFEFVVCADDRIGITGTICQAFTNRGIRILQIYASYEKDAESFVHSFFCDFSNTETPADHVSDLIGMLPGILKVDTFSCKDRLFDQLFFPLMIMQKHRVVVLRIEPLLRVEERLAKRFGSGSAAILYEEGKTYSIETIEHYKESLPISQELLMKNVVDGLRATGWGLFTFSNVSSEHQAYEVKITHPPINLEDSYLVSRFVVGIAAGVLESVYSTQLRVTQSNYIEKIDTLECKFEKVSPNGTT